MAIEAPSSAQQKQLLKVIWFAMLSAIGSYTVVCLLVVGIQDAGRRAENDSLRYAMTGIATVLGVISVWWRWHFLSASTTQEAPAKLSFARLQSHSLVVWALSEAVAIVGLAMGLLTQSFAEFLPFAVAAAALLLLHRPSNLPLDRLEATGQ